MHILITGGAGFIGSHLCDAVLALGHEVWCVDNLSLGRQENIAHHAGNKQFHFEKTDVLDRKNMEILFELAKFEMVFHLSANSDIQRGGQDHSIDLNLNFLSTYEILELMARYEVKKFFFASTSAVFGETRDPLHENYGPLKPISFYGASKLAAEAYISVYVNNYNFQAWVLRFPNVVGERSTHGAIYDFIQRLKADPTRLKVLGNGSQQKPYLYVKDLVNAILLVVNKGAEPLSVYHAGNNDLTSVKELVDIVIEEMGLKGIPVDYTGGDRGWVGDVPYFAYNTDKLRALGWKPSYSSTEAVRIAVKRILGKE